MKVGLTKTSLIDYPGIVSAVLFCAGCNMRCPYCHNAILVDQKQTKDESLMDIEEAFSFLETRRMLLSGVVVSGGEATLYKELPDIISRLKSMDFLVKLDTNGTNPSAIESCNADYIAMDLKTSPKRYNELCATNIPNIEHKILESVSLIRKLYSERAKKSEDGYGYEFRITCAPEIFTKDDAYEISSVLEEEDSVFLQAYNPKVVLNLDWAKTISPYTIAQMAELLSIIQKKAPKARIRGF